MGTCAVVSAFSHHLWDFSPTLFRKQLTKHCWIPPKTKTDSQPSEPPPSLCQVRVHVLPSTPALLPAPLATPPGWAGRWVLPAAAALAAPSAGAQPRLCCTELSSPQRGFPARLRCPCWACPAHCCLALSVGFPPFVATLGCRSTWLPRCLPHHAASSHASPSKLLEPVCKILLILLQIFP